MRPPAGDLDRRITIEQSVEVQDSAGDLIPTWTVAFKLFAKRRGLRSPAAAAGNQVEVDQATLRRTEVTWEVRDGPLARSIAPETHRVVYKGRIYIINAIAEGEGREERIMIRTSATTDQRGTMAPQGAT